MTATLLDEAVDHRKPKARAFTLASGGEKRFEHAELCRKNA